MAPEIDLFLIERVEPSFDRRQASLIRERIASMPRTELGCRASPHGQSLPVSHPSDILVTDPAAFIQLL
jgi:hypothetical protein